MHLFYTPIDVPGVYGCQKYASASYQVPENQKACNYYCLENTQIVTNIVLKEGYIMGCNLLRHPSLGLYNHFDTSAVYLQLVEFLHLHLIGLKQSARASTGPKKWLWHMCMYGLK